MAQNDTQNCLLDYLVRNRERVVGKEELIAAIWEGRIVFDYALTTRMNVARHAIGDSGQEQRLIKTVMRKGFRFVGAVREAKATAGISSKPANFTMAVVRAERLRAMRKPPRDLDAWESYQLGMWHMSRCEPAKNELARTFFQRSIDLDPTFAPGHGALAWTYMMAALLQSTSFVRIATPIARRAASRQRLRAHRVSPFTFRVDMPPKAD